MMISPSDLVRRVPRFNNAFVVVVLLLFVFCQHQLAAKNIIMLKTRGKYSSE